MTSESERYEDYDNQYEYEPIRHESWQNGRYMGSYMSSFRCPQCGSYNTDSSIRVDWCKTCGYEQGY